VQDEEAESGWDLANAYHSILNKIVKISGKDVMPGRDVGKAERGEN